MKDTFLNQKFLKMISCLLYAENAKNYRINCFDIVEDGSKRNWKKNVWIVRL